MAKKNHGWLPIVLPILVGGGLLVAVAYDTRPNAFPAGIAAAVMGSLAFVFAGTAFAIDRFAGDWRDTLLRANSAVLVACMLGIPVAIGLHSNQVDGWLQAVILGGFLYFWGAVAFSSRLPRKWWVALAIPLVALTIAAYQYDALLKERDAERRRLPDLVFTIDRSEAVPGAEVRVEFSAAIPESDLYRYRLCINREGDPMQRERDCTSLRSGITALSLPLPTEPDQYEIRLKPYTGGLLHAEPIQITE